MDRSIRKIVCFFVYCVISQGQISTATEKWTCTTTADLFKEPSYTKLDARVTDLEEKVKRLENSKAAAETTVAMQTSTTIPTTAKTTPMSTKTTVAMQTSTTIPTTAKTTPMYTTPKTFPHDCRAVNVTGIYTIEPLVGKPQKVTCKNGGWTAIQQRRDGSVDFYRTWQEYKNGFGNASSEYWIGNDAIHALTQSGRCELRIEVTSLSGEQTYANYSTFFIDDEAHLYRLHVSGYSGNAGEYLNYRHNGHPFSTKDRDNDSYGTNCAQDLHAGYWYSDCNQSNLNGNYQVKKCCDGFYWYPWNHEMLSASTMLIKCQV